MKHLGFLIIALILALLVISACDPPEESRLVFADQGFKTAIALVELHNIRYDEFPESLDKLDFVFI